MSNLTKRIILVISLSIPLIVSLSGCGRDANAVQEPISIREPQPTFTPTLLPNADAQGSANASPTPFIEIDGAASDAEGATDSASSAASSASPSTSSENDAVPDAASPTEIPSITIDGNAAAPAETVSGRIVVNTPLVNGRAGPGTDYDVVGIVGRGEEYDIVGRNAAGDWWNVCCYEEQEFWVINELVDTVGAVDINSVAVTEPGASGVTVAPVADTAADTAAAASTPPAAPGAEANPEDAAPSSPTATTLTSAAGTGDFPFELKLQEQFAETTLVRIYVYVYNQEVQALSGYSIRVTKNGGELPVTATSFGPQAGFTWPVAEPRQRFQNLEVEFDEEDPAGTWTVQLIDVSGNAVGPTATFELTANDPQQELYVRYEQR